jgi:hypothetical protein
LVGQVVVKKKYPDAGVGQDGAVATTFHCTVRPGSTLIAFCVAAVEPWSDGGSPSRPR